MSVYLMSDIHGDYDRYQEMKSKIGFSNDDKIIIIGDAIDREPDGVKILLDVMETPNIKMLPGNHELMMVESDMLDAHHIAPDSDRHLRAIRENWINNNGGYTTMKTLYDMPEHGEKVIKFVEGMFSKPIAAFTKAADGRVFLLCHGWTQDPTRMGIHDYVYHCTWDRPNRYDKPFIPHKEQNEGKHVTVVIGHTPVVNMLSPSEIRELDHYRILHTPHFINIDCGCGHGRPMSRLACINIDTMEEFYV